MARNLIGQFAWGGPAQGLRDIEEVDCLRSVGDTVSPANLRTIRLLS